MSAEDRARALALLHRAEALVAVTDPQQASAALGEVRLAWAELRADVDIDDPLAQQFETASDAETPSRSVDDVYLLDAALKKLESIDPTQGRVVELRFFGGLTIEETAELLAVSPMTIKREWAVAKAWLYRELST